MRGRISLAPLSASSAAAYLGKRGKPCGGVLVVVRRGVAGGFLLLFHLGNVVGHGLLRRAGSTNFQPSNSGIPAASICRTPPSFMKSRQERFAAQERRTVPPQPPDPALGWGRPRLRGPVPGESRAVPGAARDGKGAAAAAPAPSAVSSGGDAARRAGKKEPMLRRALEEPAPRSCRRQCQSPERCRCLPFPGQRRRGAERGRSPGRYRAVPHPPPPPPPPPSPASLGPSVRLLPPGSELVPLLWGAGAKHLRRLLQGLARGSLRGPRAASGLGLRPLVTRSVSALPAALASEWHAVFQARSFSKI